MTLQLSAITKTVARRLRRLPWRHGLQLGVQAAAALVAGFACLLLLAWLTLQWGILPHIEDWRPTVERQASKAVGVPVHIGRILVRSGGWVPALELQELSLMDADGAPALRLPRVSVAVSPASLLSLEPRLAQLYIEGARLRVRRDRQGHLHVGGLDMSGTSSAAAGAGPADEARALDWFFRQQEFVIRGGSVQWVDEQRQAPPLALEDVTLVARNSLRHHDLRLEATPPADWGERFSLRGRFTQSLFARPGDWRRWAGTLYAELPRGDVAQLRRHVDLPFELDGGAGALRLWLDVQASAWRNVTLDLDLHDVGLRLAPELQPLAIAAMSGRLTAQRDSAGVSLSAEHFGFRTAEGVVWPAGQMQVAWRQKQPGASGWGGGVSLRRGAALVPLPSAASGPVDADTPLPPFALWDRGAPVTGGQLKADHLDLGLMRELAERLPLPLPVRQGLQAWQPAGHIKALAVRWDGEIDHPRRYTADATIDGLSMAAGVVAAHDDIGRPGWRNADLVVHATEAGGQATLAIEHGAMEFPGVFEQPLVPFDRLRAALDWQLRPGAAGQPPAIAVQVRDVRFANADAEGTLQASWRTSDPPSAGSPASGAASATRADPRFPGIIDLKGELKRGDALQLARYLPRDPLRDTRSYLGRAIRAGSLSNVQFAVRGPLLEFPFEKPHSGEFRIAGHAEGVNLAYVPPEPGEPESALIWPAFQQVAGDIVFDHGALEIRNAHGRAWDVDLQGVHGAIRHLYTHPVLALQGKAQGPMSDLLRYVAQSPVGGWLGHGLRAATASGVAELSLGLNIPLDDLERATVTGSLQLPGNDLRILPGTPLLGNARGRIEFTHKSFSVAGATARVLGGDSVIDGQLLADGSLRFTSQGQVSAEGLRRGVEEPTLARLAGQLSGQTPYRLQLGLMHGQAEWLLTSPLTGLALGLPAPLNKAAEASWPLRLQVSPQVDPSGRSLPRELIRADLGGMAQAELLRETGPAGPRLLRSAYALGAPLPAAQPGGVGVWQGNSINLDAWWTLARNLGSVGAAGNGGAGTPAGLPGGAAPVADGAVAPAASNLSDALPRRVQLRSPDLQLGGHHLGNADVLLTAVSSPQGELWRAAVDSDQTHGVVEVRPSAGARGGHVFARLDRLSLDANEAEAGAPGHAGGGANPAAAAPPAVTVPTLDIVVEHFELNARKLGRLEVTATQPEGSREWRLGRLALTLPEARFVGSGVWTGAPARRMALDFKLDLTDSGAMLGRLGMGQLLKGGKGEMTGAVAWTGSPLSLDYPSLTGRLQMALDAGQFLKVDAGAGRLLGVLSLQSLPRRLTLDFRDLFQEGFAFDNITGDVQVDHGLARTNNLRMRSVTTAVLMEGSADLQAETQDLRVIVVPELNAGTASLAYAAINPVVGLGTFLAQMFLRRPLMQAGTREFHVHGPWADPKVEAVEHHEAAAAAAAAASAPAEAASAP